MARPSNADVLKKAAGELANEVVAILKDVFGIVPDIDQQIAVLTRLRSACERFGGNGGSSEKKEGAA